MERGSIIMREQIEQIVVEQIVEEEEEEGVRKRRGGIGGDIIDEMK